MFYVCVDLLSMVFTYKMINVFGITFASSSIMFPLTYSIMDVITEVYGKSNAKKIIWYGLFCDAIFVISSFFVANIPSTSQTSTSAYFLVFGMLPRSLIAQTAGVLVGEQINVYLISKMKILTDGKHFWLRSIGASTLGEFFMLIISVLIALKGVLPNNEIYKLILFTYFYKIAFAIIISPFIAILAFFLKNLFGEDDKNKKFFRSKLGSQG